MKKILIFVFSTAVILGLIKIISIAPFDRMSADDFSYTTAAVTQGTLKAQAMWYTTFTGKFVNNFLVTIFGIMSSKNGSTLPYFLITLTSLFFAIFIFFRKNKSLRLGTFTSVLLSLLFLVGYYLITPDKNESWYWLSGSVEYLWPTTFAILAFAFVFEERPTLIGYILSFALAFLVGAGGEVAGTLFLCVSFLSLLFLAIKSFLNREKLGLLNTMKNLVTKDKLFTSLLVIFLGASLSFLIMFLAPGNAIRIKGPGSNEMSIVGAIFYSLQKGPETILAIIRENIVFLLPLLLSLSTFFGFFGVEPSTKGNNIEKIFFILIAPVFLSIVYMLPGYKALGRVLPSRAEVDLSFIIIVSLFFAAYYLSSFFVDIKVQRHLVYEFVAFISALVLFISSFVGFTKTVAKDIYIAKNYGTAFDTMFTTLQNASRVNKNQTVVVAALPESGLIHSEKLNSDPGHWANKPISNFFGFNGITIKSPEASTLEINK